MRSILACDCDLGVVEEFADDGFFQEEAPLVNMEDFKSWILHEDDHVLALNKPGWLVCHPSKKGPLSSLVGAAKMYLGAERAHLVSRLDRETSGLVIIAKHRRSASQYQRAIEHRRVEKEYLAWLDGHMSGPVTVDEPLGKDPDSPVWVKQAVKSGGKKQEAVTHFEPLMNSENSDLTLAKVKLETGRKHQIRAHALWLKHHIFGDKLYGPDERLYLEFIETGWGDRHQELLKFPRQALHAFRMKFKGIDYVDEFIAPVTPDLRVLNQKFGISLEAED